MWAEKVPIAKIPLHEYNLSLYRNKTMKDKTFTLIKDVQIICTVWDNVKKPIGVIQIIHGIYDKIETYDRFAKLMNKNGYIVFGTKHQSCKCDKEKLCYFDKSVDIQTNIMKHLVARYNLPLFLFGYGYGAIITQSILQQSTIPTAGICLANTGQYPTALINIATFFAWFCTKIFGEDAPAKILNRLSFGKRRLRSAPKCTYGFYLSLFRGIKTIKPYAPFDTPMLMISGAHDSFATNPCFSRSLYNAYRDNGIMHITMIIYPDKNDNLLMEMNFGTMPNDILDFFKSTQSSN